MSPKVPNDVKLINSGKILENSQTIAQCKTPFSDLPGSGMTMHVVIQPSLIKAKSGHFFSRLTNQLLIKFQEFPIQSNLSPCVRQPVCVFYFREEGRRYAKEDHSMLLHYFIENRLRLESTTSLFRLLWERAPFTSLCKAKQK